MERSQYAPLQPSSEGPNPLRPYYRPPHIGNTSDPLQSASSSSNRSSSSYLPNIDYRDILGNGKNGPSTLESIRALTDQLLWKYSSVFLAQPFEVAKIVLQVRCGAVIDRTHPQGTTRKRGGSTQSSRSQHSRSRSGGYGREYERTQETLPSDSEEEDEMSYFTSTIPETRQPKPWDEPSSTSRSPDRSSKSRSRRRRSASPRNQDSAHPYYKLDLRKPDSLTEVLSQLWQREGAWGIWKGTNATFIHNFLLRTLESWLRGMLCAVLNLPDASPSVVGGGGVIGGLDILDSPSPLLSLSAAVVAAATAGLMLQPLDIIRTRIMLTPTIHRPRSILPSLRSLPSWICPRSLALPTLLNSTIPTLFSASTPLFLRSQLQIDPIISPASYNTCTFISSVVELFTKLPVETVLRRGQIQYIRSSTQTPPSEHNAEPEDDDFSPAVDTVVETGPYSGLISTMWRITRAEGTTYQKTSSMTKGAPSSHAQQPVFRQQKGQGVPGLWRGWKVGLWALVGVWGTAGLGSLGGRGSEF